MAASSTTTRYFKTNCFRILVVFALPSLIAARKPCVPGVTYLDMVTGHCDPCSDICEFAMEQGTLARCKTLCKGYQRSDVPSTNCASSEYYDKAVERCEPCMSVCLRPQTLEECQEHCPNWTNSAGKFDQQNLTHTRNPTAAAMAEGELNHKEHGQGNISTLYVVIGALVIICCVILVAVFGSRYKTNIHNFISQRFCNRRPHQEEAGDSTLSLPLQSPGRGPVCVPTDDQERVTTV